MVISNFRAVLVLHTTVLLAASCTADFLEDNCPEVCRCFGFKVECRNKSLNSLPLDISIWNSVGTLDISYNNFSAMPMAIGQMTSLDNLEMHHNPILSLNKTIMQAIGDTLKILSISLSSFNTWPTELRYLRSLTLLELHAIPFSNLSANAFHGLEYLEVIAITESKLMNPSEVICYLPNSLKAFYVNKGAYLYDNDSINFQPCGGQSLISMSLNYDTLRSFPNIINVLHSLQTISLGGNQIEHIDDKLIPRECGLYFLYLGFNLFTRIPFAVTKCQHLMTLNFKNNIIKYLEEPDLTGLNNLQYLDLSNNPIVYISPHAFRNNPNLKQLIMENTQLGSVPEAVASLSHFSELYIDGGKPVHCSCDMSYMRHWLSKSVYISGECNSSSKNISTFIKTTLQSCPQV